ncbi:nifR3 family TIM-barrel protein [Chitinophaga skermanii]|uniref:tRNA-dihydrouridine synthase n=1 Tax=Chitinophaga skermanii TaxID=331697 RepID=A0A327QRS8_9BACT|nr:tRNA dihydrouridine synthase DusB [Chitinophaga skermanii]RAJ06605.1 nifR3 family TIM-barrel protein [Chitinophaga skermanii]
MVQIDKISLPDFPLLLAPMEDVSDPPFRAICKENGADLMYTEFISSEGLIRDAINCRRKLDIFEYERPVGIQIFGGDEDSLAMASKIVEVTNPDLLDINFGCPVKKVAGAGAGAGVLKDIDLMVRLTAACVKATNLPVTVKTRLGWDEDSKNIEEVAERLQDVGIKALAIHGRTRSQMYKGEADWTLIGKVKNNPRIKIPIFGNGDIDSPQKALEYKNRYGVDGVMIGRAAIGYPWIFREIKHFVQTGEVLPGPTVAERVAVCKQHLHGAIKWQNQRVGINEMRGRYANYLKGLPNIKEFKSRLVRLNEVEEVEEVLDEIFRTYQGFEIEHTPIELIDYHQNCPL